MKKIILISFLIAHFSLLTAVSVSAALVPCGGPGQNPCQFCDLAALIATVINFILYDIALPLSVALIVWGGLTIMTAGGSSERAKRGRGIVQAAIIGVLITLGAFLIVRTTLSVLTGSGFEPWKFNKIDFCK